MFYRYALQFDESYNQLIDQISDATKQTKTVAFGSLPFLNEMKIADALAAFQKKIHVRVTERNQTGLLSLLDNHDLDLAIARCDLLDPERYECIPIHTDRFALVASTRLLQSHFSNLDLQKIYSLAEFKDLPFVLMESDSTIYQLCMKQFECANINPVVVDTADRHTLLLSMLRRDIGCSLMPEALVDTCLYPDLVCLPFKESLNTTTALIYLRNTNQNMQSRELIEFLQRYFASN